MKIARYKFGLLALAYTALSLQFLVPHHHHQQAMFLFLDMCPVTAHAPHEEHNHDQHKDGECHHPHSENSECSVLDHVIATQNKQGVFAGGLAWDTIPLLPLLYAVNLLAPTSESKRTAIIVSPLLYECINPTPYHLRGPPISA